MSVNFCITSNCLIETLRSTKFLSTNLSVSITIHDSFERDDATELKIFPSLWQWVAFKFTKVVNLLTQRINAMAPVTIEIKTRRVHRQGNARAFSGSSDKCKSKRLFHSTIIASLIPRDNYVTFHDAVWYVNCSNDNCSCGDENQRAMSDVKRGCYFLSQFHLNK